MFVSGFTFIRNAIQLDYPIQEAIQSVLPLVDEMVVAVGKSKDATRELVASLGDKIRIIDTEWDENLRIGGKVLAEETNKALAAIDPRASWCVYVQGDECYHEQDYDEIRNALQTYEKDDDVEGLLFNYRHFYGSYDYLGDSRTWYRKEVRIVKNLPGIKSYRDAQGFRINNRKLRVAALNAHIHHYGWVRHPKYQMAKQIEAHKLWHDDSYIQDRFDPAKDFDYSEIDSIQPFNGSHPKVIQARIKHMNWEFTRDPEVKKFGFKKWVLYKIEQISGWRPGEYKNYKVVK